MTVTTTDAASTSAAADRKVGNNALGTPDD